jgi:hypothetical protein
MAILGTGVIEGQLLRTFGPVPPGPAMAGTFTLQEGGPKTYRLKCEIKFAGVQNTSLVVSFALKRSEFGSPAQALGAALDQLVTRLHESRTSGGYQRFRIDRAEWLPAAAAPGEGRP